MTTGPTPPRLLELFQATESPIRRQTLAIKWVEKMMEDIRWRGTPVGGVIHEVVTAAGISATRELALAIPAGHPVLQRKWSAGVSASAFLPNYLDIASPMTASIVTTLTRAMWLSRDLDDRKIALFTCLQHLNAINSLSAAAADLLRKTAWDIAAADGMGAICVAAATTVTLHAYQGIHEIDLASDRSVMNALLILLIRCDGYEDEGLSNSEAKSILASQPAACARLLAFVQRDIRFKTHDIHGTPSSEDARIESLISWLPEYSDAIRLAGDMGLQYDRIVKDVINLTTASIETISLANIDVCVSAMPS